MSDRIEAIRARVEAARHPVEGHSFYEADSQMHADAEALLAQNSFLAQQIDALATCILEHFPDEPGSRGKSEGAVEVAVRLLEQLDTHRAVVEAAKRYHDVTREWEAKLFAGDVVTPRLSKRLGEARLGLRAAVDALAHTPQEQTTSEA